MFPFSKLSKNLNGKSSRKRGKSRNQRTQRKAQLQRSIGTYKTFEKKVTKERKKKKLKDNLKFLTHSKKLLYIRPLKWVESTTRNWLSQFSWDSQLGRLRTTSILVRAFWNFKLKVLWPIRNCSLHNTLIPWCLKITWIP